MFDNSKELYKNAHFINTPCLMDFSEDVTLHKFKTKSGEICDDCKQRILLKKINPTIYKDIINSIDYLRLFILNRENKNHHPIIQVRKNNGNIEFIIPDYGDLIIPLEPRWKTLYWFFLKNDISIHLKSLKNYRDEFLKLHNEVNNRYSTEKMIESVDRMIGLSKEKVYDGRNEISVVKSKINSAVKQIIPQNISSDYIIRGEKMMPNRVFLNRTYFKDFIF
jgi:hypothetical protein